MSKNQKNPMTKKLHTYPKHPTPSHPKIKKIPTDIFQFTVLVLLPPLQQTWEVSWTESVQWPCYCGVFCMQIQIKIISLESTWITSVLEVCQKSFHWDLLISCATRVKGQAKGKTRDWYQQSCSLARTKFTRNTQTLGLLSQKDLQTNARTAHMAFAIQQRQQ